MKKIVLFLVFCVFLHANGIRIQKFVIEPDFKQNNIESSYGSDLVFKGMDFKGRMNFWGISDRGPNTNAPKIIKKGKSYEGKFFPMPDFTPSIALIIVDKDKAFIEKSIAIKQDNQKISGKIIAPNEIGTSKEIGLSFDLKELDYDNKGLDPEGISIDKDNHFYISDEYGPFILKLDQQGNILKKYSPDDLLPSILSHRIPNRGFEGLTINDKGEIITIVQSILDLNDRKSKYLRILKFDPRTQESSMYAYEIDRDYARNEDAKIGAITFLQEDQFLVIEQGKQKGTMQNLIYRIDLSKASKIPNNEDLEFDRIKNLKAVKKDLILDLRKYGWDMQKAEGLALIDAKSLAIINDNDFGIATQIKDKDHNGTKIKDYIYNSDEKTLFYKDKKSKAQFFLKANAKNERKTQLWIFNFDRNLYKNYESKLSI